MTAPINPLAQLGQLQQAPRANFGGPAGDVGDQGAAFVQSMLEARRIAEQQAFQQAQLALQEQAQKSGVVERGLDRDLQQQQLAAGKQDRSDQRGFQAGEAQADRASRERIAGQQTSTSAAAVAAERDREAAVLESIMGQIVAGSDANSIRTQLLADGFTESDAQSLIERAALRRQLQEEQSAQQSEGRAGPGAEPIVQFDAAHFLLSDEEREARRGRAIAGQEQPTVENLTPEEAQQADAAWQRFKAAGKSDEEATRLALLEVQERRNSGSPERPEDFGSAAGLAPGLQNVF